MSKNISTAWNIVNGLIAIGVCYVMIFEEEKTIMFGMLGLFFLSLALRSAYNKRISGDR